MPSNEQQPDASQLRVLRDTLGYLNFSEGAFDAKFHQNLNTLFSLAEAQQPQEEPLAVVAGMLSEALKGLRLYVPRAAMPAPEADEFYVVDLVGLAVENEAGEAFGTVAGLISTGAHDVLQVREGDGDEAVERLIPFVAAYVLDVDLATRRIRVAWQQDW